MHTWWVILGLGGAGMALGILAMQWLFWLRLRRIGADEVGILTQGVALAWVGGPLAALHVTLFLMLIPLQWTGWWLGGGAVVVSMPLRRLLNLKAISVIVRRVEYAEGPVLDRDGERVDALSYRQLVRNWYRHEYTGAGVDDVVILKVLNLLVHFLLWAPATLGAQASHVLMCQDPADALGHETDGHERPGDAYRALGSPRLKQPQVPA